MTKKKPKRDQGGTGRPVSGGGEGGKTRSPAEEALRKKFDEDENKKGQARRPGTEPGTY